MKQKLRLFALLALSATICLSSCKKDKPPYVEEEGGRTVILQLDMSGVGTRAATRASIGPPVTSSGSPGMQKVDLYLYDESSGLIYDVMSINETQLTAATGANGFQISNLHPDVDAIAIVCNDTPDKGLNTPENTNISVLFAKELNITLEQDFLTLTYYGKDDALESVVPPAGGSADVDYFKAEVTVVPLVARIEISDIEVGIDDQYSSLLMKSIYVENVYKDGIRLDYLENFAASSPSNHLALQSDIEGSNEYWWLEILGALNTPAYLSTTAWSPKYGDPPAEGVFAFHVFQRTDIPPTIGLQLTAYTNGTPNDGSGTLNTTPQYVRFNTYQDNTSQGFSSFSSGNIYKIQPIFNHAEVSDFSTHTGDIVLFVTVEPWTIHDNIIAGP